MSIFNVNPKTSHLQRNCFFDEPVDVARYDKVRYPQIEKLTTKQQGQYWRPQEVELIIDSKNFKSFGENKKHMYTGNLKRQILLDSVQGRGPALALLSICSLPEIENFILAWSFFEAIHSQSYTHIIRNVYADPGEVFDGMTSIQEIADCAKDISKYYDDLIQANNTMHMLKEPANYGHKKLLWMCLNAINALEGIRFYVSFACSWNFAELKEMEGSAKIIKLIARDENVHLAFTQQLLKILPKEDPDFAQIKDECAPEVIKMFEDVISQEKTWARYLMIHGSIIGLNERLLCDYVDFIGSKRMVAIGLDSFTKVTTNPLPWTQKWIAGSDVQVAPQEVELSSYVIGAVKQDVGADTFKGFKL